ncbi:MAG: hypothetical protein K1X54_03695 [Flavobacteriales bacterium]|nr:hypothetical protein [Flavobacteriales bacterium]
MLCYRHTQRMLAGFFILITSLVSHAQAGNEWINYNQQYWKFPIASDGLYQITYNDLLMGGFPVSTVDPRKIQLFGRGFECPLHIEGESDGIFNSSDYIEFYAQHNDGWLDSLVYENSDRLANPAYSLYNDTIHYFLTVSSQDGLRRPIIGFNNFDDYTPEPYCWHEATESYHEEYLLGLQDINGIGLPGYDVAEGWFDNRFPKGGSHTATISTQGVYQGLDAPPALVRSNAASASIAVGFPNHHLQVGWGNPIQVELDTSYYGYQLIHTAFSIPASSMTSNTVITHRSIDDLGVASDYHAVSFVSITYPHSFSLENYSSFHFFWNGELGTSFRLIEISNFNSTHPRLFVLNSGASKEIQLFEEGGHYKAIVPVAESGQTHLWLMDGDQIPGQVQLSPVTQTGYFSDYASQENEHTYLIITHPSLLNSANNYGAWRNNGDVHSLVVNVEELYMQYACGIWKNPLAIRRFCDDLIHAWVAPPEHLFIIGKSIHEADFSFTSGARNDPEKYAHNLVPTWGYPGSDALFTAGLNGTLYEVAIPTGRLAAQQEQQVLEYLNKVIEHESQPPALWQKNVMHFGGGTIAYEQALFKSYLENYSQIAADTSFGGVVYPFYKNTSDPIQMNVSDSIQLLINEGVSLMTFFGHASSTGFDQNIDTPQSYDNQGKYPLLIGNSCYTGNIHLSDAQSASENFVLVPDRGMIGFLAKTDLGIPVYLNLFTENFYKEICQLNYGKSIGECMKLAVRDFQVADDFYRKNVALNFTLHGDPAIRLHAHEKPDYNINASSISFEPADITASISSFDVHIVIENIGKATHDDVGIELIRHYPDGTDSVYVTVVDQILHRDTVTFHIPNNTSIAAGDNRFDVYIDYPLNAVEELNDMTNNIVTSKSLLITSGDLFPVVPYSFEVVPTNQVTLKASTGFAFEEQRQYIIQADTTDLFNSPFLMTLQVTQGGGVVEWPLNLSLADSTVVFWRCSRDSISPDQTYNWYNSSFQYISGEHGWGQDHFFQFRNNLISGVDQNNVSREWQFEPTVAHLKCQVYGAANTNYEALATRYQLNLNVLEYGGFGFNAPALMVAVLDSSTFTPWASNYNGLNPNHDFGNTLESANARGRAERYFIFQQGDPTQLQAFNNMMEQIPDSQYVLIYTWQFAEKQQWEDYAPEINDFFASMGANAITALPDSLPFIVFFRKGEPQSLIEIVGGTSSDYLVLETDLIGSIGHATIQSPLIGPAENWGSARWNFSSLEPLAGDQSQFILHGLDEQGADHLLAEINQSGEIDDLSSLAPGTQFPYLRLETRLKDTTHYTSPQLDRWHVLYDRVPECAINPQAGFFLETDSLVQGQFIQVAVAIENISDLDMDSLMVQYTLEDAAHNLHMIPYPMQSPLLSGEILFDTLSIDTRDYAGNVVLHIEANPVIDNFGQTHQREQSHFNNLANIRLHIEEDRINPILDVTFDGQHILQGDIVSVTPHIVITLDDENEYFILNEEADTSRFKIYLTSPDNVVSQVFFASPDLDWIPASAPANKFRIDYTPALAMDGTWQLRVQGSDKSGNLSGSLDYEIDFNIISKPTITEVVNYPNPFTTRTQFVFTLTGTVPPDQVKIQIMNINGDIVREITQDELGPLRIGRNFTEYWWDGTDEFGDRLANGVYLYRVQAKLNGEPLEISETTASRFFNRGFGKMYLFR